MKNMLVRFQKPVKPPHRKWNQWKKFLEANPQSTDLKCEPCSVEDETPFASGRVHGLGLKTHFPLACHGATGKGIHLKQSEMMVKVECRILFPPPRLSFEMALIPQNHHNDPPKSCHVQQMHLKKQKCIYFLP